MTPYKFHSNLNVLLSACILSFTIHNKDLIFIINLMLQELLKQLEGDYSSTNSLLVG